MVTTGAQTTAWSSAERPRTKCNITEPQPRPLRPLQLRFANHFRPQGRATSTEAFLITIILMVLKAHVKLLLPRVPQGENTETPRVLTADAFGSNGS